MKNRFPQKLVKDLQNYTKYGILSRRLRRYYERKEKKMRSFSNATKD